MTILARITHRYTNGRQYFAVETSMSEQQLNKAIAFIQYVRNDLPIMEIQYNDCVAEPDCIYVLENVFGCKQISVTENSVFDVEIDLYSNWDLAFRGELEDINVAPQAVAGALLDVFLQHANEIMFRRGSTEKLQHEFGYLRDIRSGKPALIEWGLKGIGGEPIVGSFV